jgi:hypothetical protein
MYMYIYIYYLNRDLLQYNIRITNHNYSKNVYL